MRLEGKSAFITGAGSGLGRSAAKWFAAEGATVVGTDVNFKGVQETVDRIMGEAAAHELDVRDLKAFRDAVNATVDRYEVDTC